MGSEMCIRDRSYGPSHQATDTPWSPTLRFMQAVRFHPYLNHPGPLAFAHRGGAEEYPENSLAAFAHAVSLGYRYLETDVHLTADGVVLAFHDDSLDRVTDRSGVISECTAAEVAQARISGVEHIPTLDELFDTFPETCINIDPKDLSLIHI